MSVPGFRKPPLGGGGGKRRGTSQSAMSIYNLAKDELSASRISEEENVAGLRGRLPPGPDSRKRERVPQGKLWLRHAEKTAMDDKT